MIKVVILDVDGVLTDGTVIVDSSGNEYKRMDYRDIDAIFALKRNGIKIGLVTGESSAVTEVIRKRLQPEFFYGGCKDKAVAVQEISARAVAARDEICYVGDGTCDVAPMGVVGWAACPTNAVSAVKAASNVRLKSSGGAGCIRELLEWIEARGSRGEGGCTDPELPVVG